MHVVSLGFMSIKGRKMTEALQNDHLCRNCIIPDHAGRLPQDVKVGAAALGLHFDKFLVSHCSHPTTLLLGIVNFHPTKLEHFEEGFLCLLVPGVMAQEIQGFRWHKRYKVIENR